MMTINVLTWWRCLCVVGAINIVAWSLSALALSRRQAVLVEEVYRVRRLQVALSAVYVFGCAFRSAFPVFDVPRLCLVNGWLSSVMLGRSVATLAELCFVAQWALLLNEMSLIAGSAIGRAVSLALVPLIVVAETCSWYSVLTTSNLGHVAEESIWGLCAGLLVIGVLAASPRLHPNRRPMLIACCVAGLAYVAFMYAVDVPMYWSRWVTDETLGRPYLTLIQGAADVATRRVVSHRWADWRTEVAWMTLYFSVAVWISISMIHAPRLEAHRPVSRMGPRPSGVPAPRHG